MEIDFNKARSEAFLVLKERDNVSILDSKEKQRLKIGYYAPKFTTYFTR